MTLLFSSFLFIISKFYISTIIVKIQLNDIEFKNINLLFTTQYKLFTYQVRDRPFNLKGGLWFFVSFRIFFRTLRELKYLCFFVAQSANFFFFTEFNIRLYDKNSESDYFFIPPPKSEYFFQQQWESEYFF